MEAQHPEPALDLVRPNGLRRTAVRASQGAHSLYGRDSESLLLNLDASLGVHTGNQMFSWTQGLLQSLIPFKILTCAMHGGGDSRSSKADSFSTLIGTGVFGDLLLRDATALPSLIEAWKQHKFIPVICDLRDVNALSGSSIGIELGRVGATELLIHGCRDLHREVGSLFVFAGRAGRFGEREAYLAQLIAPFLAAAWIRSRAHDGKDGDSTARSGAGVLTEREREILRWICLGKSNWEIGAILKISPLTVKNHVKKILRKLNVVNRAQAVGKALDARIISP